jgi:hypothetical protein
MRRLWLVLLIGAALAALAVYLLTRYPTSFNETLRKCVALTGDEQETCIEYAAHQLAEYDVETQARIIDQALSMPEFGGVCHLMAHELGAALFTKTKSLPEALAHCTDACSSGCYHGASEEYLLARLSEGKDLSEHALLNELEQMDQCTQASDPACARNLSHAAHGAGHALMFVLGNDLPATLKLCDTLINAGACHSGAFMSNYLSLDDATHPSRFIRRDDPQYPCTVLDERYASACFASQADFFLRDDVAANVEICRTFPEAHQTSCLKRVANLHIQDMNDPQSLAHVCDVVPDDSAKKLCIENIVNRLGDRKNDSDTDIERFCEALEPTLQTACAEMANQVP